MLVPPLPPSPHPAAYGVCFQASINRPPQAPPWPWLGLSFPALLPQVSPPATHPREPLKYNSPHDTCLLTPSRPLWWVHSHLLSMTRSYLSSLLPRDSSPCILLSPRPASGPLNSCSLLSVPQKPFPAKSARILYSSFKSQLRGHLEASPDFSR